MDKTKKVKIVRDFTVTKGNETKAYKAGKTETLELAFANRCIKKGTAKAVSENTSSNR